MSCCAVWQAALRRLAASPSAHLDSDFCALRLHPTRVPSGGALQGAAASPGSVRAAGVLPATPARSNLAMRSRDGRVANLLKEADAIHYRPMSEFKDVVPHTGGVLSIHIRNKTYQLEYVHGNPHRMALVELLTVEGNAVAIIPFGGMSLRDPEPDPPQIMTMLPTDADGMYGRRCPKCDSYFRTEHVATTLCPYCDARASWREFLTTDQKGFIKRQHDAILAALQGPDGVTKVDFDEQIIEPTRTDRWVYSEERQQTRFKCANDKCRLESDVLGEYVRCPGCGHRTDRAVITRKLAEFSTDFEADAKNFAKENRDQRQRRWRHYLPAVVSEFEVCGREVARALAMLPATPSRRKALQELSFQHPVGAAASLKEWFDIDTLQGIDQGDQEFLHRMFNRRHLFTHCGGRVDQEYLDKTGDQSVRLNEVVRVDSKEVRRLMLLVEKMAVNLLDGFDSIS